MLLSPEFVPWLSQFQFSQSRPEPIIWAQEVAGRSGALAQEMGTEIGKEGQIHVNY